MPPEEAFWKALALVGVTSLAAWGAIWIFVAFQVSLQSVEWLAALILFLLSMLFLTPLMYSSYRRGPRVRTNSRRVNILLGTLYTCVAFGHAITDWRRPIGRDPFPTLVFACVFFLFAVIYFYRAFKTEDPSSLQL